MELITEDYRRQQQNLHAIGNYGVTAQKYGKMISGIVDRVGVANILDYGCGSNLSLLETFKPSQDCEYQAYDPGVPEYAGLPIRSDMVVCIDVLEHVEPHLLDDVLDHLEDLTDVVLFASINTGPAGKTLEDGRNAHLTQAPYSWWLPKFWERFNIQSYQQVSNTEFYVVANALGLKIDEGPKPVTKGPIITNGSNN